MLTKNVLFVLEPVSGASQNPCIFGYYYQWEKRRVREKDVNKFVQTMMRLK